MLAILGLCLAWQALQIQNLKTIAIPSFILKLIALGGCLAIALTATSAGVLISMVHLLSFSYILKAFEIKQRKDFYQLLLIGLFLLASAFIFTQILIFSIGVFFALILNLVVLHKLYSENKSLYSSAKTVLILILQSAFLAIFLFIIFPRLSPFWQVPNNTSAKTALSDDVSPGDIASLALSSELAFRVDFKGSVIPLYSQLYWRAMTLENYDGRKWSRSKWDATSEIKSTFVPITSGKSIIYDVIVEANYQPWLFGLTVATTDNPKLKLLQDYSIRSRNVLTNTSYYQVESYLQAPLDLIISDSSKQRNLAIVKGSNPKLEALALKLMERYPNPIDRSNAVLALFNIQEYFYTLEAPLLINNSLDQFFFDTKAGFCVHYASSYTYLMRAAGIPARLVTGYLGGEYNDSNNSQNSNIEQQSGHLSIYQYDAHAWSEIWIEGVGWYRVDPTSAVDPQRVNSGWSTDLLAQQSLLNNDFLGLYQFKQIAWLNELRLQFDALDYQWTRWVLGYSNEQQYNLLKKLFGDGIKWKATAIIFSVIVGVMLFLILIKRFNFKAFKKEKTTVELRLYKKILSKLAKKGLIKPIDMTPN
jgi:transglutaminase-like putative cysteine protease